MKSHSIIEDLPPQKIKRPYKLAFIFEPIYYMHFYFVLLFLQSTFFVAPEYQSYINYFFVAWGSLIALFHAVVTRRYYRHKVFFLYILATLIALATVWLNREAGYLVRTLKVWYLPTLLFTIFYAWPILTAKDKRKAFKGITITLSILTFLANILSIFICYLNITGYVFQQRSGAYWGVRYIARESGKINPLLQGVYTDSNFASFIVLTIIFMGLLVAVDKQTKFLTRLFLWVNYLIGCYVICLTNSRATMIAAVILALGILGILLFKPEIGQLQVAARNSLIIAIALLLIFVWVGNPIRELSFKVLEKPVHRVTIIMPHAKEVERLPVVGMSEDAINIWHVEMDFNDHYLGKYKNFLRFPGPAMTRTEDVTDFSAVKEDTSTKDVGSFGNGRIGRWKESFKLPTLHRPLTGVGPTVENAQYFAKKYATEEEPYRRLAEGQATVNSYLTYLLFYGWPAFAVFMLFGLVSFILSVRNLLKTKADRLLERTVLFMLLIIGLFYAFMLGAMLELLTFYSALVAFVLGTNTFHVEKENLDLDRDE